MMAIQYKPIGTIRTPFKEPKGTPIQTSSSGGTEGTIPDESLLKTEYYKIRGLDPTGIPSDHSLIAANLDYLVPLLKE